MIGFKKFIEINEKLITPREYNQHVGDQLHLFDLDDTLVTHSTPGAKVHVVDSQGNTTERLTPAEFNQHKLPADHKYDFTEFGSSSIFANSARPIPKMVNHMKRLLDVGHHVHILTARSDMDDKDAFLATLKQFGVDISNPKFHVHRAGNLGTNPTHINKAAMINTVLTNRNQYRLPDTINHVVVYDDHEPNVTKIFHAKLNGKSLLERHPAVRFEGQLFRGNKLSRVR